jgi:hypothetical protein
LVVNVIYCDLPHANAVSEECEDVDTHNIYINRNLPHDRMREEIKHELIHIINDDFFLDKHVDLIEQMVRRSHVDESELENIAFYHHYLSAL